MPGRPRGERIPLDPKSGGLLNAAAAAAEVLGQLRSGKILPLGIENVRVSVQLKFRCEIRC